MNGLVFSCGFDGCLGFVLRGLGLGFCGFWGSWSGSSVIIAMVFNS